MGWSFWSIFVPVASAAFWNFLNSPGREMPVTEPSWGRHKSSGMVEDSVLCMSQPVGRGSRAK